MRGGHPGASRGRPAPVDAHVANDRGCTCAHWAAAGGDTDTLAYLRDVCRVDLRTPNAAGHTPLEHACAYKRTDIVSWLVSEEVVDPRAVEYALRVAALDADDANLRAITGMLVPNICLLLSKRAFSAKLAKRNYEMALGQRRRPRRAAACCPEALRRTRATVALRVRRARDGEQPAWSELCYAASQYPSTPPPIRCSYLRAPNNTRPRARTAGRNRQNAVMRSARRAAPCGATRLHDNSPRARQLPGRSSGRRRRGAGRRNL